MRRVLLICIVLVLACTGIANAIVLLGSPKAQFFDNNGHPLAGGLVWSYRAGTSTLTNTYSDYRGLTANFNPIVLDARGEAVIYIKNNTKLVLETAPTPGQTHGSAIWTFDNLIGGTWIDVIDIKQFGAIGDGVADDTAAIQAAANAVSGKVYFSPATSYKITSSITISANTTVLGDPATPINQTTAGTPAFIAGGSNIRFRDIKVTGNDTLAGGNGGIYCPGTKTSPLSGISFENCNISGFQVGIMALWASFYVDPKTVISGVGIGIYGGTVAYAPADQNDTASLDVRIDGPTITCTMGNLTDSRPVCLPFYLGNGYIRNCKLRGGGMAIETVLDSANAVLSPFSVYGNDCDTSISTTNGGTVGWNIIDLSKAPAGRGQHPTFYQAIEAGYNSTVIGNIIRNHTNGLGQILPNQRIIGNTFENCGDQGAGAGVGGGWVIGYSPDSNFSTDTVFNTLISENTFRGTRGAVADIALNWQGTHAMIGLTVSNNKSYDGNSYFILVGPVQQSKVQNNTTYNCCKSLNTAQAFGIWSAVSGNTVEFLDNTFVNTVAGGYGMYQAIAPQAGDIIGYQKCVGLRNYTAPIENSVAWQQVAPVYSVSLDGLHLIWYDSRLNRVYANNAAALAGGLVAGDLYRTSTGQVQVVY